MYKFKEGLYGDSISYSNGFSVLAFFGTPEQTKEFFKYLYFEINKDDKERKKGNKVCCQVVRNDNDREPLVDVNYNFFIEVLAKWIEHYSLSKHEVINYDAYGRFSQPDEDGNAIKVPKYKKCSIDFTTAEKVIMDYSYSGWRIKRNYYKFLRFYFIQTFFNNYLGKHTYVVGYGNRYRAKPISILLVKDNQFNSYVKLPVVSFVRSALIKYLSAKQMKRLHEISDGYEVLSREFKGIEAKIEELEAAGKKIGYCNVFNLNKIENERNILDGTWHLYVKKDDEEEKEILDQLNDETPDDIPEFD